MAGKTGRGAAVTVTVIALLFGGAVAPASAVEPPRAVEPPSAVEPGVEGRVGYTASTAVAGESLEFAATGFAAGEEVLAVLDDAAATSGPIIAGPSGSVSGALSLPVGLRGGTHVLAVEGMTSGVVARTEVTVEASENAGALVVTPASDAVAAIPGWVYLAGVLALFLAALAVLALTPALVLRAARRRRARRSVRPSAGPAA